MANKPSERRNFKEEEMELNLTPMMNLIAILIPCLLVSVAFVEVTVVNVSSPSIGPPPDGAEQKSNDIPVNLTVTITERGYTVSGSVELFPQGEASGAPAGTPPGASFIPTLEQTTTCQRYLDTVAPPRSKNKGAKTCTKPDETRSFVLFDVVQLARKLIDVKDRFPDERRIIIAAEPDIEFEALTDVMDASRDTIDAAGEVRTLFDEVVLSPGNF